MKYTVSGMQIHKPCSSNCLLLHSSLTNTFPSYALCYYNTKLLTLQDGIIISLCLSIFISNIFSMIPFLMTDLNFFEITVYLDTILLILLITAFCSISCSCTRNRFVLLLCTLSGWAVIAISLYKIENFTTMAGAH